jgi:hypothetical protein
MIVSSFMIVPSGLVGAARLIAGEWSVGAEPYVMLA